MDVPERKLIEAKLNACETTLQELRRNFQAAQEHQIWQSSHAETLFEYLHRDLESLRERFGVQSKGIEEVLQGMASQWKADLEEGLAAAQAMVAEKVRAAEERIMQDMKLKGNEPTPEAPPENTSQNGQTLESLQQEVATLRAELKALLKERSSCQADAAAGEQSKAKSRDREPSKDMRSFVGSESTLRQLMNTGSYTSLPRPVMWDVKDTLHAKANPVVGAGPWSTRTTVVATPRLLTREEVEAVESPGSAAWLAIQELKQRNRSLFDKFGRKVHVFGAAQEHVALQSVPVPVPTHVGLQLPHPSGALSYRPDSSLVAPCSYGSAQLLAVPQRARSSSPARQVGIGQVKVRTVRTATTWRTTMDPPYKRGGFHPAVVVRSSEQPPEIVRSSSMLWASAPHQVKL